MSHFIALIHKDPNSGYGISFPDVPGVTAVADTLDQALLDAADVLAFAFEDWEGDMPSPRSLDELRADPAFMTASSDAVVAAVAPRSEILHAA